MKRNKKSAKVVFLAAFIAMAIIAIAGMNMRTLINNDGLTGTARKAGANDAVVGDVLENYTFTSDTAGTGVMGSITDYSRTLTQLKLLASSANQTVTLPLNPGYYTQVKLDTTEVYEAGYDNGYEKAVKDSIVEFSTNYGRIDVIWLSGTSNTVTATPNAPVLTSGGESMTPVKWNASNEIVTTTSSDSSWYSYVAGSGNDNNSQRGNTSSHWANARTANGSYFVWIPRFAYRITYYDNETSTQPTGYYDGKGMWNAYNGKVRYELETGIETITYNNKEYIVHPAFNTDLDLGGWNTKITGFWVAKFEMSGSTAATLKSTFGVQSQRYQSIGVQYVNSRQATYGYTGTIDGFDSYTSFMQSHMMKNSEWGAVAYLTHSQYGRNGINITKNSNSYFYTGGGQNSTDYVTNVAQSTTGNTYGIYDMCGGAEEYVAIFNTIGEKEFFTDELNGKKLVDETPKKNSREWLSTKYVTIYYNGFIDWTLDDSFRILKSGDSSKEVHNIDRLLSDNIYVSFWGDKVSAPTIFDPFIARGGIYNATSSSIFSLENSTASAYWASSFRTILTP